MLRASPCAFWHCEDLTVPIDEEIPLKTNICLEVGNDGVVTNWGYVSAYDITSFGKATPDVTKAGQHVYAFSWDAAGNFTLRFGGAGNEIVPDVDSAIISWHSPEGANHEFIAGWDSDNSLYSGTDLDMATALIAGGEIDQCFTMVLFPNLFITYDFATILRGTA